MKVDILLEAGIPEALLGLSLSYYDGQEPLSSWWKADRMARAFKRANALAHRQGGHNKFLESCIVWIHVRAARSWWQEFDTYRVGMTKQSASTMHTLAHRQANAEDFVPEVSPVIIEEFNRIIQADPKNIRQIKANLPEGFLQDRIVCTNYKVLQVIVAQRKSHRLKYWDAFIEQVLQQITRPKWLDDSTDNSPKVDL